MVDQLPGFFDLDDRLAELSAKGDSLERVQALVLLAFIARPGGRTSRPEAEIFTRRRRCASSPPYADAEPFFLASSWSVPMNLPTLTSGSPYAGPSPRRASPPTPGVSSLPEHAIR